MNKRTAIIDIGSNSARIVIFEESSDYGFHLICEQKSKVRIGEGAYAKKGYLQPHAIKRAFLTLKSFICIIEKYQVNSTICVATSALRDAPNAPIFTAWIKDSLGLEIKIIDGKKEAEYGAIAVSNLLPIQNAITIDIGGGSSDISCIQNGKIKDSYSLNIGTVRIKELFFDQALDSSYHDAKIYIQKALKQLPSHFRNTLAVGIGGTARTLSKAIMKRSKYPLDKLHAFSYNIKDNQDYLNAIPLSSLKGLKVFGLKKNRYDTIREGTLIFNEILSHIEAKEVMSSSVGVREGVFLDTFLAKNKHQFPKTQNPSIVSLIDRFKPVVTIEKKRKFKLKMASTLYRVFQDKIQDQMQYHYELEQALKLTSIGKTLTIYKTHQHAFYIAMQELNYGFTHKQIVLISLLLRMHSKELLQKELYQKYQSLLPKKKHIKWLSFIYTLTVFLHEASNTANIHFSFAHNILTIYADRPLYLAKENIASLETPENFSIQIEDEQALPKNPLLAI
ncbi:Exopolyphosphatase [hydrothermal vent metagenome]|uniref:Exopolyphosphatase n=1 Tax=hydrothermal vent metagenome TaxID=652676 RepID=A0A1W1CPG9_9ZZZZ